MLTNSPGMIFRSTPVKAIVPVANVFEIPASVSRGRLGAPGKGLTIGVDRDIALRRFLTAMPIRLDAAKGGAELHTTIVTVDDNTGRATGIRRYSAC